MLKLRYWILLLRYLPFMDNPVAQNNLGIMYEKGLGAVPKNYLKAVKWYRKAAEQGHADAQYRLAFLIKDNLESFKWCKKAAEQGNIAAQFLCGQFYKGGDDVPSEIPKDINEAIKWYHLAAERGHAGAQYQLGHIYLNGEGLPQDELEAFKWYEKAAEQGSPQELNDLGVLKLTCSWLSQNFSDAARLLYKSAERNCADAQYQVGFMHAKGMGLPKDNVLAHMWLNLAAAQGKQEAISERHIIEESMTTDQIAEAHHLSREWKPKQSNTP